ncbi:hypothetical protein SDC9_167003 [bioreactor metagenome]|uniref:Uncharacterized protein n=1 Tax=bioreactor metagenome TaxID=1076179 RepID=A0A645FYK4_9ZZZZ
MPRMNRVNDIPAVVDDDVRFCGNDAFDATVIFGCVAGVMRKHVQSARGKSRGNVVLRGERVAAGDIHFRSARREHAAKVGGFCFQMD